MIASLLRVAKLAKRVNRYKGYKPGRREYDTYKILNARKGR